MNVSRAFIVWVNNFCNRETRCFLFSFDMPHRLMRDRWFLDIGIEIESRVNASFECQAPNGTILQLSMWQSIECPVASIYTRSAPREPDLGNLDRRSLRCSAAFQLSVVVLMAKLSEGVSRSGLPVGNVKQRRRRRRGKIQDWENFRRTS